jgi:hypothetical protein
MRDTDDEGRTYVFLLTVVIVSASSFEHSGWFRQDCLMVHYFRSSDNPGGAMHQGFGAAELKGDCMLASSYCCFTTSALHGSGVL